VHAPVSYGTRFVYYEKLLQLTKVAVLLKGPPSGDGAASEGDVSNEARVSWPFSLSVACQQCGGSGMFIPDPGSDFFPSRIRTVSIPDPGSSSKNLSILTPKKQKNGF
jgi:hypothetical protein